MRGSIGVSQGLLAALSHAPCFNEKKQLEHKLQEVVLEPVFFMLCYFVARFVENMIEERWKRKGQEQDEPPANKVPHPPTLPKASSPPLNFAGVSGAALQEARHAAQKEAAHSAPTPPATKELDPVEEMQKQRLVHEQRKHKQHLLLQQQQEEEEEEDVEMPKAMERSAEEAANAEGAAVIEAVQDRSYHK